MVRKRRIVDVDVDENVNEETRANPVRKLIMAAIDLAEATVAAQPGMSRWHVAMILIDIFDLDGKLGPLLTNAIGIALNERGYDDALQVMLVDLGVSGEDMDEIIRQSAEQIFGVRLEKVGPKKGGSNHAKPN